MNFLQKGSRFISDSDYRFMVLASHGLMNNLADEEFIKRMFHAKMGTWPNLIEPRSYNEKLQWLKLHDRNPLYTKLVDKYEVKRWVADRIGEEHVIPTYGVWESFDDICFSALPNSFVLKCTHDSGGLVICRDGDELDKRVARRKIESSLKRNFYWHAREWPYKNVTPRVLAEKYMEDESGNLVDYKVLCFDGEPRLIEVHQGRNTGCHYQDFYDTGWNKTTIWQVGEHPTNSLVEKPLTLDQMLFFSRKLSEGFPHVRVDWYVVFGRLFFGELTFYDAAGFDRFVNDEDDQLLGSWITVV